MEKISSKHQATPFRKKKKKNPGKPGRQEGNEHVRHAHREAIPEEQLDEIYDAPLPPTCPCCGSKRVCEKEVVYQYQTETPRRSARAAFPSAIGRSKRSCNY